MRMVVSIPDELLERIQRLARSAKRSKSDVITAALREYLARRAPDEVTKAIDLAIGNGADTSDDFVAAAARRVLKKTDW